MYADTLDGDLGGSSIEVFELQLAHVTAVHRVSPLATKLLDVEMVGTHTDFLVRVKGNTNLTVLNLLVLLQINHRLYDFGNTSLVVGTQQSRAVCHDEVFAYMLQQFRELLRTRHDAFAQQDVATIVVLHYLGLDVGTRAVRTGVVVGNETDGGHMILGVGLQGSVDVTLVVHLNVIKTFAFQFLFQVFCKNQLFTRTRHRLAVLSRLRVKFRIVQKSLCNIHFILSFAYCMQR